MTTPSLVEGESHCILLLQTVEQQVCAANSEIFSKITNSWGVYLWRTCKPNSSIIHRFDMSLWNFRGLHVWCRVNLSKNYLANGIRPRLLSAAVCRALIGSFLQRSSEKKRWPGWHSSRSPYWIVMEKDRSRIIWCFILKTFSFTSSVLFNLYFLSVFLLATFFILFFIIYSDFFLLST